MFFFVKKNPNFKLKSYLPEAKKMKAHKNVLKLMIYFVKAERE